MEKLCSSPTLNSSALPSEQGPCRSPQHHRTCAVSTDWHLPSTALPAPLSLCQLSAVPQGADKYKSLLPPFLFSSSFCLLVPPLSSPLILAPASCFASPTSTVQPQGSHQAGISHRAPCVSQQLCRVDMQVSGSRKLRARWIFPTSPGAASCLQPDVSSILSNSWLFTTLW